MTRSEGEEGGHRGSPRATVELSLQCGSPEEAQTVWTALSADDPGSFKGAVEGSRLRIVVGPATLSSLRTSCDDILACFQAARGAAGSVPAADLEEAEGPAAPLDRASPPDGEGL